MPVTADEIRRFAAPLPRTEVAMVRDSLKFRIRSIVYLAISPDERTIGFAFPKAERADLVASEPAKFHLPRESDLRFNWVQAWLAALDPDEMRELVLDAWQMVVPKKVAAEYLATDPIRRAARGDV
ncbi:MmcQ/YjbR family DNA-binding protein [Pseudonocardia sp. CA-107938]|uniref:MmcQ/YjbR family DNA-binding protein n=1 Tax=Pseudonocardia sp. CA-107938 TaxID=3240021 RepID=UPI003D90DD20